MPRFFINRPIFAWVIAIMVMLGGLLAIKTLPVSQYPAIAPPQIAINATYPGASAQTVQDTVTQVIEQKLNGIDNLIYMASTSDSAGAVTISLTFKAGTDPNIAQVQVQNKLQLAVPLLPQIVQKQGIAVVKSSRNYLLIIGLVSEDGSMDRNSLTDYMVSNLQDIVSRLDGVGELLLFGTQNAMRIWLNPAKLNNYHMTTNDVIAALQAQNVQVSAGQFGGLPATKGQQLNATINARALLQNADQFNAVILRTNPDGSTVRLKDVAESKIGTENYEIQSFYNGKPLGGMAVRLAAGANALETGDRIKAKMAELSKYFPPSVKVVYPYDSTPFVKISIEEVVHTLIEAVFLVFIIMFLFLQNIRATLIPTIAVPVVLLGTFAVLGLCGFSINMLTMFGMVLAIGLLVDDAIVVVENVERLMSEEGLSPREATAKSMEQITSALIGIGLVLAAVFGPMAFFPGSTGIIYRQFSVTIVASMLLSVVVALILTPVLCASLLKPVPKGHETAETGFRLFRPFFAWFNRAFFGLRDWYVSFMGRVLGAKARYLLIYLVIVVGMGFLFSRLPTGYLPDEDQGSLFVQVTLPSGSTIEQTGKVMKKVSDHFLANEKDAVEGILTSSGQNMSGRGQNIGMAWVKLKDWDLRRGSDLRVDAVVDRAMKVFSRYREAMVFAFAPPAVVELGNAKGVDFELQDRGGLGHKALMAARDQILAMAQKDPRLNRVRPNGLDDVAQYKIKVDWDKAGALGVPITAIHETISTAFGSSYVNNFLQGGRVKRVDLQADAPYRMAPKDLEKLYVRNTAGKMVPFSSFASGDWTFGSPRVERFNAFPAIEIWGEAGPGKSSGEAMRAMEEFAAKLPQGFGFDWTGLSYQERMASSQAPLLYAFSVLVIFLCLAALYESWPIPISILLALPLGAVGCVLASGGRGLPNDIYFQIGLLTTLGLTTKNAILIVQFAKARVEEGKGLIEATLEGAKLRLRPILMTSLAFGFGVLPLAFATGAGAGAQKAIGTGVLGGMVTGTLLVIFFAPLFYVLIVKVFTKDKKRGAVEMTDTNPSGESIP